LQSNGSTATTADSAMENHQYDKLKQDRPAKVIVTSEEGKDQLREKSPSTEGSIRINGSEHGSKYQVLTTGSQFNFVADCHCKVGTTLMIHRFNDSDNGYYSCQIIVSNNSCQLSSSPHGYVAVGEIRNERSMRCTFENQLPTPMCAENAASLVSQEMKCISESLNSATVTIGVYSTHIYNTNSAIAVTSTHMHNNIMVTLPETPFDREQNMVWVYGLMAVFIIVLVLSLVLVSIKCRTQRRSSKRSKI
jgi:hypothetical protein